MGKIVYLPGDYKFFLRSTGKTRHANGVIIALNALHHNYDIEVLAGVKPNFECTQKLFSKRFFKLMTLSYILSKAKDEENILLIRKNWWTFLFLVIFSRRKIRARLVLEVNGFTFERYVKTRAHEIIYRYWLRLHQPLSRLVDRYYVVNQALAKDIEFFDSNEKIYVGYNGAPMIYSPVIRSNTRRVDFVFLGNLRFYNDWSLLESYFAKNQDINLHIIGFGEALEKIEQMGKCRNIHFHGYLEREEYQHFISTLDNPCGLIPIRRHYGEKYLSPIKLGEYLSLGMPVIMSSNVDSISNVVDLQNIVAYSTGSEGSFAEAISSIKRAHDIRDALKSDYSSITWEKSLADLINFS